MQSVSSKIDKKKKFLFGNGQLGDWIYPARVIGYLLLYSNFLLSPYFSKEVFPIHFYVVTFVCLLYPHVAYLYCKKSEFSRKAEQYNLIFDMVLIGLGASYLALNPILILPYAIANSMANYSSRGVKLVFKGCVAFFSSLLLGALLIAPEFNSDIEYWEIIPAYLYLIMATHYVGYISYIRGLDMKKTTEKAVKENFNKTEFLTQMSHEIRTPMNAIIGMSELCQQESMNDKASDYINRINTASKSLLKITNDILDLAKVDSGKIELELIEFSTQDLIEEIQLVLLSSITQKKLKFIVKIDESIPKYFVSDPLRLQQILINLISNAIKFTQRGEIKLIISSKPIKPNLKLIRFDVQDTGIGFDIGKFDNIFESFSQAQESTTRKFGGSGLGLSIVKKLVTIMGGQIFVTSQVGKGSTFSFELPMQVTNLKKAPLDSKSLPFFGHKQLLIVDDEVANQIVAKEILERAGCEVEIAHCGEQAVKYCRDKKFDLILMDIRMPGISGFEATTQIRNNYKNESTPIVAISADIQPFINNDIAVFKMQGYFSKPIDTQIFLIGLSKWLDIKKYISYERNQNDVPDYLKNYLRCSDELLLCEALARVSNKADVFIGLLKYFKEFYFDSDKKIDLLMASLELKNKQVFLDYIHKLKGVSCNIAAKEMMGACDLLFKGGEQDNSTMLTQGYKLYQKSLDELLLLIGGVLDVYRDQVEIEQIDEGLNVVYLQFKKMVKERNVRTIETWTKLVNKLEISDEKIMIETQAFIQTQLLEQTGFLIEKFKFQDVQNQFDKLDKIFKQ